MTSRPQFSLGIAGGDNDPAAAHAAQSRRGLKTEFPSLGYDQVRNLMRFEMPPHVLDWIEFGGISRQPCDHESSPGGRHVVPDQQAAMDRRPIPDDQDLPSNVPLEVSEELDYLGAFDAPGLDLEIEPPEGQTTDDGEALPVEGLVQQRSLPTRSPRTHSRWAGAQSAFVNKDDGAALLVGLFFKAGQSTRFHRRIDFSFRSTARRSGRWQLKPLAPSKRQTCPG